MPSATPPSTPPAPPKVTPVVSKPPTTVKRFELEEGADTLYLPFANGAVDAAYPQSRLLKARTILSDDTVLPVANWSILSGGQSGKVTVEGGLVRVALGASEGSVVIRASSIANSSLTAERTLTIATTPRRVLAVKLSMPPGVSELYVPADGSLPGDNNLAHHTEAELHWQLDWKDGTFSHYPDDSSLLEWTSLSPETLAVDPLGRVSVKPASPEGTASLEVRTRTVPAVTRRFEVSVRRDAQLWVEIE